MASFGGGVAGVLGGAGGGNFVGGSIVRLLLDAAQFEAGLKSSEARMHAFGRRVHSVGRGMSRFGAGLTRNVTVPVVAAAAASVKMAVDFEGSFTKIRANSNLTSKEIDKLRGVVLDLAGKTAKSPIELADGLYFLASAGLTARQVQETLERSAKASAAGFGEVGDIARLTANVLNAYAKDGVKAAEVTDVLAAAVREGTAEPDEFANAMGRILPTAQKAGVGFDEIAASLAGLSNIGLDVNEGVTAMRGLLLALSTGGAQAEGALEDLGLTFADLRASIEKRGILDTFRMLEDRTGGNIDKLRKLIPNVRAMSGAFGLTSQKADDLDASYRAVTNSTGDLDRAFRKTKKDPGFQMRRLMSEIQALAIDLGREALPVLKDVVAVVRDGVEWFKGLSEETRKSIVKWGLLAAALGPIVSLLGGIVSLGGKAIGVIARMGTAAAGAGTAAGAGAGAGAGAAGGAAAGFSWKALGGTLARRTVIGATAVGMAAHISNDMNRSEQLLADRDLVRDFVVQQRLAGEASVDFGKATGATREAVERLGVAMAPTREEIRKFGELDSEEAVLLAYRDQLDEVNKAAQSVIDRANGSRFRTAARNFLELTSGVRMRPRQSRAFATVLENLDRYGIKLSDAEKAAIRLKIKTGDLGKAYEALVHRLREGIDEQGGFKGKADETIQSLDLQAAKVETLGARIRALRSKRIRVEVDGLEYYIARVERLKTLMEGGFTNVQVPGPQGPGGRSGGGGGGKSGGSSGGSTPGVGTGVSSRSTTSLHLTVGSQRLVREVNLVNGHNAILLGG